jgi:hypothetical protein
MVMAKMRILCCCFSFFILLQGARAQREPDRVYMTSIESVKLHPYGDPLSYPIVALNSGQTLELGFDDLDAGVKTFYYSLELCNLDWTPVAMSPFDYVKGFSRVRITTYRNSSGTLTRYTHYQAVLPDRNCMPTKAGNYMLRVFQDGDTSKLAFTRRLLVVDNRMPPAAQVLQPFSPSMNLTHHRLQVQMPTKGLDVRYPQQQVRIVVLQNHRWDNALVLSNPTFVRQDLLQYVAENEMVMPAGKEWRWVNLRSFRLLGDRVGYQKNSDSSFALFVQEENPRLANQYFFFSDINGFWVNETTESVNPLWNADYASVSFRFRPPGGRSYPGQDLYVFGEMTGYGRNRGGRMTFDPEEGVYKTTLRLKQGYYNYMYATRETGGTGAFRTDLTENNSWETENQYTVLFYYRELGGRYDQLLGVTRLDSRFRQGPR